MRWMYANHPKMADKWADHTKNPSVLPEHIKKEEMNPGQQESPQDILYNAYLDHLDAKQNYMQDISNVSFAHHAKFADNLDLLSGRNFSKKSGFNSNPAPNTDYFKIKNKYPNRGDFRGAEELAAEGKTFPSAEHSLNKLIYNDPTTKSTKCHHCDQAKMHALTVHLTGQTDWRPSITTPEDYYALNDNIEHDLEKVHKVFGRNPGAPKKEVSRSPKPKIITPRRKERNPRKHYQERHHKRIAKGDIDSWIQKRALDFSKSEQNIDEWIGQRLLNQPKLDSFDEPEKSPPSNVNDYQEKPVPFYEYLEAARFLAQKEQVDSRAIAYALEEHEDNPVYAALHAYQLPQTPEYAKILTSIAQNLDSYELNKTEDNFEQPKTIRGLYGDSEELARAVKHGFDTNNVQHVNLSGKHSKHSILVTNSESKQVILLKPDDNKLSPAKGEADYPFTQPIREAVSYHISKILGLDSFLSKAEAILLDDKQYAAIVFLPNDYKDINYYRSNNPDFIKQSLLPYLNDGTLYKLAIFDWVIGQTDRHAGNVMLNGQGELRLIDQGSALAGPKFDPGNDPNSFTPYYLRAWAPKGFTKLNKHEKFQYLPKLTPEIDVQIKSWIKNVQYIKLQHLLAEYSIPEHVFLARLKLFQDHQGPLWLFVNKLWCGIH